MVATMPTLECRRLAAIRICSHPGRFAPGAPARFSRGCLVGEKPRRQQRHWPARRALFLALAPRDAGDVDMCPVVFLREARQEARGGDAAAGAAGDVREIGEVAVETFLIV